ncbi:hypothetical protein Tco_0393542 [Tanacetum coccineum]
MVVRALHGIVCLRISTAILKISWVEILLSCWYQLPFQLAPANAWLRSVHLYWSGGAIAGCMFRISHCILTVTITQMVIECRIDLVSCKTRKHGCLPFDLEAFTNSNYAGVSLDKKSTTGGCQFLRSRLITWQCKKQTVVANSTTEAEYVAASNCYSQVLWIQNQMLDYGYNFMNTKIFIDNESTICIVKNLVFHSKTKHIEIRHHFIRDSNEKKLIQMIKIHTDQNVADLLTKAFDVSRF